MNGGHRPILEICRSSGGYRALDASEALDRLEMVEQWCRMGCPIQDIIIRLCLEYGYCLNDAEALATTAIGIAHRKMDYREMWRLERDFTGVKSRYRYTGPDDALTRPFCRELMRRCAEEPMTLAEIAQLDNGELPHVIVTGGGWCCRHQWVRAPG